MTGIDGRIDWGGLSEAYAFLGNSLLAPMTQTAAVGLDPAFWEAFPDFGSADVRSAANECARFAADACAACEQAGKDAVERCAVEYTRLFVGPPKPAALPWETAYRGARSGVGFGEPTFQMRRLLREAGLELCNENRQYEDHLGIELLFLSTLCARAANSEGGNDSADSVGGIDHVADANGTDRVDADDSCAVGGIVKIAEFIDEHPLGWVADFRASVAEAKPGGYFDHMLAVVEALLRAHRTALR